MIKRQGWRAGMAVLGAAAIASGAVWATGMGGGDGRMHASGSKPGAHACMHAPDGDAANSRGGPGMGGMQGMGGMHGKDGMQGMGGMHGMHGKDGMAGMHGKDGMGGKHGMGRMQAMHGTSGMHGPTGEDGHRGPGHDGAPGKAGGGCHD